MERLIITAAITGSRITRETAPHIPITPGEIVWNGILHGCSGPNKQVTLLKTHTRIRPSFGTGWVRPQLITG